MVPFTRPITTAAIHAEPNPPMLKPLMRFATISSQRKEGQGLRRAKTVPSKEPEIFRCRGAIPREMQLPKRDVRGLVLGCCC